MAKLAAENFYKPLRNLEPVVIGPVFEGSRLVGGADADLICGGMLIELKTNRGDKNGNERRLYLGRTDGLDQLIGYVLLDFHDEHRMNAVAVYAARWGRLARWPLTDFMNTLAGRTVNLADERSTFSTLLERLEQ